jgi:hypothetical protein
MRSRQAIILSLAALFSMRGARLVLARASNLDEGELPDRDQLSHDWMALLHRLDRYEIDLVAFDAVLQESES